MNSLEEAKSRLDAALAKLDQAVAGKVRDMQDLRASHAGQEGLRESHEALRAEHGELRQLTEHTVGRLETALSRLGTVLESKAS